MASRRVEQAAATRQRLLAAARVLFAARGFDDTNLRDVAAGAKVAVGTVFVHFADKSDLLHACLYDELERVLDATLATSTSGPLLDRIGVVGDAVFGFYEQNAALSKTLLRHSLLAQGPWAQKFAAQLGRAHGAVAGFVVEARAVGEVRHDVDVTMFALAFLSFFQFSLTSWVQGAHPNAHTWWKRLLVQHVDGVRPTVTAATTATTTTTEPESTKGVAP
ncbi:MAG TPA: TetR/AcrR family transcriptional regulator [Myxococcota bacterium]